MGMTHEQALIIQSQLALTQSQLDAANATLLRVTTALEVLTSQFDTLLVSVAHATEEIDRDWTNHIVLDCDEDQWCWDETKEFWWSVMPPAVVGYLPQLLTRNTIEEVERDYGPLTVKFETEGKE